MNCDTRKLVVGVSDQVRHKLACAPTENGYKLEISNLEEAKTKGLISFAVTAKLICAFDFTYLKHWFAHDAAQISAGVGIYIFFCTITNSYKVSSWKMISDHHLE